MTYTALQAASSGMSAAQLKINDEAHRTANTLTAGYKGQSTAFATLGYINKAEAGTSSSSSGSLSPNPFQIGLGVRPVGTITDLTQGPPVNSDDPNHLMIQGNGYFQVELPSGQIAYTRSGVFTRSAEGNLVTLEGFTVLPGITIPQNALSLEINRNGQAFVKLVGQTAPQSIGQIELASFSNPGGLEATDNTLYLETASSGAPVTGTPGSEGFGSLLQRWYEGSNVNPITSVMGIIEAQRLMEANSQVLKAAKEMSETEIAACA